MRRIQAQESRGALLRRGLDQATPCVGSDHHLMSVMKLVAFTDPQPVG